MISEVATRDRARRRRPANLLGTPPVLCAQGLMSVLPSMALLLVAVIWGVTFSVVDETTITLPAADLVAWRFGLAAVILLLIRRARIPLPAPLRRRAIVLGGLLGTGFLLQTWALTFTDAVMSGFLVGTLVIMAPTMNWALFGDRPGRASWCAVAMAGAGLVLLSLRGNGFGPGEVLTLAAASVWAVHLVLLAHWARPQHAFRLARIQIATVAIMALVAVAASGWLTAGSPLPALPAKAETWLSVAFLAVLATALAMIALSWAQSRLTATRAAVILSLEPAAAGITAAIMGSEIGFRTIAGGSLLVLAMLVVELGSRHRPVGPDEGVAANRHSRRAREQPGDQGTRLFNALPGRSHARHRAVSRWPVARDSAPSPRRADPGADAAATPGAEVGARRFSR